MASLPETTRAVELRAYDEQNIAVFPITRTLPALRNGQVMVRMHAASINPSDISFMRGQYGIKKKLPAVPGFEGCGTVIASGGGMLGAYLKGKRVSCAAAMDQDGTYAEYMVTQASTCLPLKSFIPDELGATMIVNPFTAWALVAGIARKEGYHAIVQNAAAGALGRMIYRLAAKLGMEVINIVRRPEQVEELRREGARHILLSDDDGFDRELAALCKKLNARIAFDAVAGEATESLCTAMPPGSRVIVYGGLSGAKCAIQPGLMIFGGQRIEGFWLSRWLAEQGALHTPRL
ncbi:MAG: zinc-binding dehydrogenase, partial [Leptospiraceae bacterium]|nr:zinc-binding dehydrogenase [Leptospiraceae bacterium]